MVTLSLQQKSTLGLFLVIGTALVLAGTALISQRHFMGHSRLMRARFVESVSGLEPSAAVRYQGLRVGRVERIAIAEDAPEAIEVVMSVDPCVVLYEGTLAQLDNAGLTGLKAINLTPGDSHKPALPDNALLPSRGSLLTSITPDPQPPSIGSSFASASASAVASQETGGNSSSNTSLSTHDVDANGLVNSTDVSEFINLWFGDTGAGC